VPICFIHGEKDLLIPSWMSQKMYEVSQNSLSEIHFFAGARHAGSFRKDPEKYRQIVMAFVEKIETSLSIK